jgi:cytochrome c oxidase subunit 1/cytochrome c oxidase subunit I+III
MLDERLGKLNFWTMFIGFNLAFLPMHLTGLLGMPRRVYTYGAYGGWGSLNLITSLGAFLFAFGLLLLLVNVLKSRRSGDPAGANPWDAYSLEWAVPSPPPPYNFAVIPTVASRYPLWEGRLGEGGRGLVSTIDRGMLLAEGKQTIGTTGVDAVPDIVLQMAEDSYAPFWLATGTGIIFVGLLFKSLTVGIIGAVIAALALIAWLWPTFELREREPTRG